MSVLLSDIRAQALMLLQAQAANFVDEPSLSTQFTTDGQPATIGAYGLKIDPTRHAPTTSTAIERDVIAMDIINRTLRDTRAFLASLQNAQQASAILVFAIRTHPNLIRDGGHLRPFVKPYTLTPPASTGVRPVLANELYKFTRPYQSSNTSTPWLTTFRACEALHFFGKPINTVNGVDPVTRFMNPATWT